MGGYVGGCVPPVAAAAVVVHRQCKPCMAGPETSARGGAPGMVGVPGGMPVRRHEPSLPEPNSSSLGLVSRRPSRDSSCPLYRRMRNRTYGGVGGRRG